MYTNPALRGGLSAVVLLVLAASLTATDRAKNARSIVMKVTPGTFDASTGGATYASDPRAKLIRGPQIRMAISPKYRKAS